MYVAGIPRIACFQYGRKAKLFPTKLSGASRLLDATVVRIVLLPALIKSDERNSARMESQGKALLKQVGLEKRAAHKPYQLSGGEQQRVAIARALINRPAVVFCDEPTGNLDSHTGKEIIGLLKELNVTDKQTFVIVTHDKEIARMSHRTIHMQDGRLIDLEK